VTLKAHAAPKGTSAASSKAASSHTRSELKDGAPSKTGAPSKPAMQKSTATQDVPMVGVLKIRSGIKRPSQNRRRRRRGNRQKLMWHRLLSPAQFTELLCGRSLRLNRCLGHRLWCRLRPHHQVTLLVQSLLWLCLRQSPIYSFLWGLKTYRKMSEAETTHQTVETVVMESHTNTSTSMFLYIL
jgi:hypothetical protein